MVLRDIDQKKRAYWVICLNSGGDPGVEYYTFCGSRHGPGLLSPGHSSQEIDSNLAVSFDGGVFAGWPRQSHQRKRRAVPPSFSMKPTPSSAKAATYWRSRVPPWRSRVPPWGDISRLAQLNPHAILPAVRATHTAYVQCVRWKNGREFPGLPVAKNDTTVQFYDFSLNSARAAQGGPQRGRCYRGQQGLEVPSGVGRMHRPATGRCHCLYKMGCVRRHNGC